MHNRFNGLSYILIIVHLMVSPFEGETTKG